MSSDATILEGIGEYKYGFSDPDTSVFKSRKGLDREIVEKISEAEGGASMDARIPAQSSGAL